MHRFQHASRRPAGQITRGKTAPNRLRGCDRFLAAYAGDLIRRRDAEFARAWYVDLGYGADPVTTLESARRLRALNPELPVLGVEIDPERVARALPSRDRLTDFRLGGFHLPLAADGDGRREAVRLVRAFNVLRQYDEAEVAPAYRALLADVLPGGLLVDGTSDPFGRVWTAGLLRRGPDAADPDDWRLEALVLGLNFRAGFDPEVFQTRLPKAFIHRMVPGEPVHAFIEGWKAAARDTRNHAVWGPRAWFVAAGRELARRGWQVARPDRWLGSGWLVWRPQSGLEAAGGSR